MMSYRTFDVRRIAGALGAEVSGVDLGEPLDDAVIAEIRQALLDHQVIFFRDQHLTPGQHLGRGRCRSPSAALHQTPAGGVAAGPSTPVRAGSSPSSRYGTYPPRA